MELKRKNFLLLAFICMLVIASVYQYSFSVDVVIRNKVGWFPNFNTMTIGTFVRKVFFLFYVINLLLDVLHLNFIKLKK